MRNGVDFNASSGDRSRRNWQKVQKGALTGTIGVTSPITNTSTAIGLALSSPNSGLGVIGGGLKVGTDATLSESGSTLSVNLKASGGLHVIDATGIFLALGTTGSTVLSTGVGGLDLRPQSSTTILAGPATGAAAAPTFRALSTLIDNSTITVTSTGVLAAAPAGVAAIIAGDPSILIGTSTGSTTVAAVDSATGGISTASDGLALKLSSTGGSTLLVSTDFTTLATSTQIGTIGGSGLTYWVTNNTSQASLPNNTQANGSLLVNNQGAVVAAGGITVAGQAQYQSTAVLGAHYSVNITGKLIGASPTLANSIGVFVRADKSGHATNQGISFEVFDNLITFVDWSVPSTIGNLSVSIPLNTSIAISVEVNGNTITGTANGNVLTVTNTHNATNQGVGFYNGASGTTSTHGITNFSIVSFASTNTYSGLFTNATGVGILLADNSLTISSTGLSILQATSTANGYLSSTDWGTFNNKIGSTGVYPVVSTDPISPADGRAWYNSTAIAGRGQEGGVTLGRSWLAYTNSTNGTSVTTSTATISLQTSTFPANFLTAGKTIRVHMHGLYNAAAVPGLLKIGVYHVTASASTALDGDPSNTPAAGASGAQFMSDYVIQCRSVGAAGQLYLTGLSFFNASSVTFGPVDNFGTTIDTTKAFTIAVVLNWTVNAAGNLALADAFTVEILDPPA